MIEVQHLNLAFGEGEKRNRSSIPPTIAPSVGYHMNGQTKALPML